jgi:AcrR family transcriptional regulator
MARSINEQDYAKKQNEILDTAQRLIYTIGYEQMTIQNVIDECQMSKGAFYHYFKSKNDLLEALINHMTEGVILAIQPIADDPTLTGMEKINKFFSTAATWKSARKPFFIALMRSWYSDSNTLVRDKTTTASIKIVAPILNSLVAQAVSEGSVHTAYPEFAAEIIFTIFIGLGDTVVKHVLSPEVDPDFERLLLSYSTAIEKVLGVEPNQLKLIDAEMINEWREPIETIS